MSSDASALQSVWWRTEVWKTPMASEMAQCLVTVRRQAAIQIPEQYSDLKLIPFRVGAVIRVINQRVSLYPSYMGGPQYVACVE